MQQTTLVASLNQMGFLDVGSYARIFLLNTTSNEIIGTRKNSIYFVLSFLRWGAPSMRSFYVTRFQQGQETSEVHECLSTFSSGFIWLQSIQFTILNRKWITAMSVIAMSISLVVS